MIHAKQNLMGSSCKTMFSKGSKSTQTKIYQHCLPAQKKNDFNSWFLVFSSWMIRHDLSVVKNHNIYKFKDHVHEMCDLRKKGFTQLIVLLIVLGRWEIVGILHHNKLNNYNGRFPHFIVFKNYDEIRQTNFAILHNSGHLSSK